MLKLLIRFLRSSGWFKSTFDKYDQALREKLLLGQQQFLRIFQHAKETRSTIAAARKWKQLQSILVAEAQQEAASDILSTMAGVTIGILLNAVPVWIWSCLFESKGFWLGVGFFFSCWGAVALLILFFFWCISLIEKITDEDAIPILLLLLLIGGSGLFAFYYFGTNTLSFWSMVMTCLGLSAFVSLIMVFLFFVLLDPLLMLIVSKRIKISHQTKLLGMAWEIYVDHRKGGWLYYAPKRAALLSELEQISCLLLYKIPAEILSHDPRTKEWTKTTYAEMAQGVRDLKKECIVPGDDSVKLIREALFKLLNAVVTDNWKHITRVPFQPYMSTKKFIRRIIASVLIATIPLALAILSAVFHIPQMEPSWQTGIIAAAAFWLLVCLFKAIDPSFQEKLEIARTLISINPFKSSDKEGKK